MCLNMFTNAKQAHTSLFQYKSHLRTLFTLHHSLLNMSGYRFKISYLHAGKVIGEYCSEELYESETACRNAAEKVDYDYCCGYHIEVLPQSLACTDQVKAD
jgi:hypothetical protein